MPNTYTTLSSLFTAIANAIRQKTGSQSSIVADDFPAAISNIPTGITPTGTYTATANGTYDVTSYANCQVAIPVYDGTVN